MSVYDLTKVKETKLSLQSLRRKWKGWEQLTKDFGNWLHEKKDSCSNSCYSRWGEYLCSLGRA
jgi:hypothetical protein